MKILNLYAGIGGNRKLWPEGHQITAVEINSDIAAAYKSFFPGDDVICGDAHEFLLQHYREYDFIWSSPPCQTHSAARYYATKGERCSAVFPDMTLYQEILFLQYHFAGRWVIENVRPYYMALIPPTVELSRHLFWSNVFFLRADIRSLNIENESVANYEKAYKINLSSTGLKNRRQILRNCTDPRIGHYIFSVIVDSLRQ